MVAISWPAAGSGMAWGSGGAAACSAGMDSRAGLEAWTVKVLSPPPGLCR